MKKRTLALSKVYQLLEPGPVVLLTTAGNVMTMSWHMMVDFVPPQIACVVSNRNYSFNILKKTKECVINIPTEELAEKAVQVGNVSGKKVDKFKKFTILQEPAKFVQAPLLPECYVNLECKVIDTSLATKYNIFILEVVKAWIRPTKTRPLQIHHAGYGTFIVDGKEIHIPSLMP